MVELRTVNSQPDNIKDIKNACNDMNEESNLCMLVLFAKNVS